MENGEPRCTAGTVGGGVQEAYVPASPTTAATP